MDKQVSHERASSGLASQASGHPAAGARRSNWEVIEHSFTGGQALPGDPQFPGAPTATSIHDFPGPDGDTSCGISEVRPPANGGNDYRSDCEGGLSVADTNKGYVSGALPSGGGGGGGGGGGKKHPFDKDEVESVLIEHSRKSWWNLFVVCKRIFR